MRASIIYTFYYLFMYMNWLKYVRKDWLENMRGTTLEVAILADVSRAYSAISSVNLCVTRPL